MGFIALILLSATGAVLLLSAAGIYAMMSFTVAKRRREIGVRTALGASRGGVLRGIFTRAAAQIGAGVAFGLILAALLGSALGILAGRSVLVLPGARR